LELACWLLAANPKTLAELPTFDGAKIAVLEGGCTEDFGAYYTHFIQRGLGNSRLLGQYQATKSFRKLHSERDNTN
jgi:hypothetical protein